MPCASHGRAGTRGGSARKKTKKCGEELIRRRKFRRELAKLYLWWRNAGRRKKFPVELVENLKREMSIVSQKIKQ